jgi:23S rRNA (uracil1939-C5)-methyltransferase
MNSHEGPDETPLLLDAIAADGGDDARAPTAADAPQTQSERKSPSLPARKPRAGDEFELSIESFDARGRGRATLGDMRFEVRQGTVGARVRARVLRRHGSNVEAIALETLQPSPHAVEPICAHFRACGGCSFQDLAYGEQLAGLRALVVNAYRSRGLLGTDESIVAPVIGAPSTSRYRNKMEFTFSNRRWIAPSEPPNAPSGFALGLHASQLFSKVIDVRACPIQAPVADAILASVRELAIERAITPWDLKTHTGLLRHLVLRVAGTTGEVLVNLVTSSDSLEIVEPFARAIVARHPEITTFVQNINTRPASTAMGERENVLFGPGFIRERLCGVTFDISANSFFQTNSAQAERLFEIVREEAGLTGHEVLYDLYCGTGTIALVLARHAREVIGFEIVPSAVADARANALRNGITNARFVEGDALAGLAFDGLPAPDVCIVDPPRAGLHPKLLPRLAALGQRRIVYVSCNPNTAANDVALLATLGWRVRSIRPIDLFPHTPHIESVLRLEKEA